MRNSKFIFIFSAFFIIFLFNTQILTEEYFYKVISPFSNKIRDIFTSKSSVCWIEYNEGNFLNTPQYCIYQYNFNFNFNSKLYEGIGDIKGIYKNNDAIFIKVLTPDYKINYFVIYKNFDEQWNIKSVMFFNNSFNKRYNFKFKKIFDLNSNFILPIFENLKFNLCFTNNMCPLIKIISVIDNYKFEYEVKIPVKLKKIGYCLVDNDDNNIILFNKYKTLVININKLQYYIIKNIINKLSILKDRPKNELLVREIINDYQIARLLFKEKELETKFPNLYCKLLNAWDKFPYIPIEKEDFRCIVSLKDSIAIYLPSIIHINIKEVNVFELEKFKLIFFIKGEIQEFKNNTLLYKKIMKFLQKIMIKRLIWGLNHIKECKINKVFQEIFPSVKVYSIIHNKNLVKFFMVLNVYDNYKLFKECLYKGVNLIWVYDLNFNKYPKIYSIVNLKLPKDLKLKETTINKEDYKIIIEISEYFWENYPNNNLLLTLKYMDQEKKINLSKNKNHYEISFDLRRDYQGNPIYNFIAIINKSSKKYDFPYILLDNFNEWNK